MKKYLSVLELYIRLGIYKALAVCLGSGLLQLGIFYVMLRLQTGFLQFSAFVDQLRYGAGALDIRNVSPFYILFGLSLIAFVVICMGWSRSSKYSYTLQRLCISERQVFLLHSLSGCILFTILFLWEALVMLSLAELYAAHYGFAAGPQGIAADFYRNSFLHGLLPLQDGWLWFRNKVFIILCAISSALGELGSRYGSKTLPALSGAWIGTMVAARFRAYPAEGGTRVLAVLLMIIAVCALAYGLLKAHSGRAQDIKEQEA
ncbi:MAG: hypothetical protein IJM08_00870 [Firmicutes bacterium]|nr:hypothetical protein [Bacillota bacterium]